jgi:hypothetical protein
MIARKVNTVKKANISKSFSLFGMKIRIFGYVEINKPKENKRLRKALSSMFSDLNGQEVKRVTLKQAISLPLEKCSCGKVHHNLAQ